jgi:hypothetical protein
MRLVKRFIYGAAPKTSVIKAKAHLFTLLTLVWTAFTLLGVLFFRGDRDPDHWIGVTAAVLIWTVHLVFAALSVYFWITEQPKPVLIIDTETDIRLD